MISVSSTNVERDHSGGDSVPSLLPVFVAHVYVSEHRDSRKIDSKYPNQDLKYFKLKFNCIRGGLVCPQGTAKRKTSTLKIDCPAHIYLRATPDGRNLEIRSLNVSHNHEISEELFRHLPQQRKLPPEVREQAKVLLDLDVNKKLLQQKLQRDTGKIVTLKDLSNLAAQDKRSNDLGEAVTLLQDKYDVDIEILKEEDTFVGLFIQTLKMKNIFENFPEFLAFDATYKLLSMNMSTFIFLV
ncbi:hypothetical protein JTE90_006999 [Oedothorax gibbosus]|uniref:FAR1 domain-containing protein n=1 Tax=Oedothorax gibbosus TaxID=931172 RepID=A0AAV6TVN7_9ARAC|nr:hypothetical protein JTE90_006999 [Oedothorax gibbosus]